MATKEEGTRIIHELDLKVLFEAAAEAGANKALKAIGLGDENAAHDVKEVRTLMEAYRAAKRTAWTTFIRLVITAVFGAVLVGAAIKLKIGGQ